MTSTLIGSGVAVPSSGGRLDSLTDRASRRPTPAGAGFSPETAIPDTRTAHIGSRTSEAVAGELPMLRRRTDRGEPADTSIEIPPHLERRRAWREAFGLNTFHTQQLAQRDAGEPSRETRNTAAQAYRSAGWRGRLDLDLAQAVSVTV